MRVDHESTRLTGREAERLLGVGPRMMIRLAQAGEVRAIRLGDRGRWGFSRHVINEIVCSSTTVDRFGPIRRVRRDLQRGEDD